MNTESQQHALTCCVCVEVGSCKTRREIEAEEASRSIEITDFDEFLERADLSTLDFKCDESMQTPEDIANGYMNATITAKQKPMIVVTLPLPKKECE